jgi:hypothetical protein
MAFLGEGTGVRFIACVRKTACIIQAPVVTVLAVNTALVCWILDTRYQAMLGSSCSFSVGQAHELLVALLGTM